jgi:hypothetical protein
MKDIPCSLDDLSAQESPEDYHLALGTYALRSTAKAEQVLVNFENSRGMPNRLVSKLGNMLTITDREEFLGHMYAARYLQRMELAFGIPNKLYHDSKTGKR